MNQQIKSQPELSDYIDGTYRYCQFGNPKLQLHWLKHNWQKQKWEVLDNVITLTACVYHVTARLYLLPKISQVHCIPIISGNGLPSEQVDSFLRPLAPQTSHIHDTPDFLQKLDIVKDQIPVTVIVGTINFSSL